MKQPLAAGAPASSPLLRQSQPAVTIPPYALPPQPPPPALKSRIMTALSGPAASTTSTRADQPASPVPIPTAPPDLVSSRPFSRIPQDLPEMPAPQPLSRRSASLTWREQLRAAAPALAHAL